MLQVKDNYLIDMTPMPIVEDDVERMFCNALDKFQLLGCELLRLMGRFSASEGQ